jgi:hypothetical protein
MITKKIEVDGVTVECREDGMITRPYGNSSKFVENVGSKISIGYLVVQVSGKPKYAHQMMAMAFLDDYSEDLEVGHINGDKTDNRLSNLTMVTRSQNNMGFNSRERKHGYRGIWKQPSGRYTGEIKVKGKKRTCGTFDTRKEAALARDVSAFNEGYPLEGLNFPWIFNIQPNA